MQASAAGTIHDVGCDLTFEVTETSVVAFQVAPSTSSGRIVEERFEMTRDGQSILAPIEEIAGDHGGRVHLVRAPSGALRFVYRATLRAHSALPTASLDNEVFQTLEAIVALRPSRYCPSDALAGFAAAEFPGLINDSPEEVGLRVADWVFERTTYSAGSSGPLDTAIDSLLSGVGVCRDFAHLAITLYRALAVPARLVSVYAPGLSPMDFHAVVEFRTRSGWRVLDPSRLAPRQSLVRIATGRDAADTALVTTLSGNAELRTSQVFASTDGPLPIDYHASELSLA
jgi:transglutaminase-like putative cysteine protease